MKTVFSIQLKDQPTPARVEAEKVEEQGSQTSDGRLIFKDTKGQVVADFKGYAVLVRASLFTFLGKVRSEYNGHCGPWSYTLPSRK